MLTLQRNVVFLQRVHAFRSSSRKGELARLTCCLCLHQENYTEEWPCVSVYTATRGRRAQLSQILRSGIISEKRRAERSTSVEEYSRILDIVNIQKIALLVSAGVRFYSSEKFDQHVVIS